MHTLMGSLYKPLYETCTYNITCGRKLQYSQSFSSKSQGLLVEVFYRRVSRVVSRVIEQSENEKTRFPLLNSLSHLCSSALLGARLVSQNLPALREADRSLKSSTIIEAGRLRVSEENSCLGERRKNEPGRRKNMKTIITERTMRKGR